MSDPGLGSSGRHKRRRRIKSCLTCRTKKLRCDREQPCGQCQKSRRGDPCTYPEDHHDQRLPPASRAGTHTPLATLSGNPTTTNSSTGGAGTISSDVQPRADSLETPTQGQQYNATPTPYSHPRTPAPVAAVESQECYQSYEGLSNSRSLIKLVWHNNSFIFYNSESRSPLRFCFWPLAGFEINLNLN